MIEKKEQKKIGRPTDNPKETRITIRLDDESKNILELYSKRYNISKTESARVGIKKLKSDL